MATLKQTAATRKPKSKANTRVSLCITLILGVLCLNMGFYVGAYHNCIHCATLCFSERIQFHRRGCLSSL
jgi:hypothetical protein